MDLEATDPALLFAKVMHKRLFPKVNAFVYGIYYLAIPLFQIDALNDGWRFGVDRPGLMSFYRRDHGGHDGGNLDEWARRVLSDSNIPQADGEITLICMPRILGYVFNPVSFWLCRDRAGDLRAVLYEVRNTFRETHLYVCARLDRGVIDETDILCAEKTFHVSPFLNREGHYRFKVSAAFPALDIRIDYFDGAGRKQLVTSLFGRLEPATRAARRRAFWRYPLVTLQAIGLIHFQACKLIYKGIRHRSKPDQMAARITQSIYFETKEG